MEQFIENPFPGVVLKLLIFLIRETFPGSDVQRNNFPEMKTIQLQSPTITFATFSIGKLTHYMSKTKRFRFLRSLHSV